MFEITPTHYVKEDAMWEGKASPFRGLEVTALYVYDNCNQAGFDSIVFVHATPKELTERHNAILVHPKTGKIFPSYPTEQIVQYYGIKNFAFSKIMHKELSDLPDDALVAEFDTEQLEPILENLIDAFYYHIFAARTAIDGMKHIERTRILEEHGDVLNYSPAKHSVARIVKFYEEIGLA